MRQKRGRGNMLRKIKGKSLRKESLTLRSLLLFEIEKNLCVDWHRGFNTSPSMCLSLSQAYRFSQLPEMVMGSPPPPVPPRTGPVAVASLRR